jgi:hypothetical protein
MTDCARDAEFTYPCIRSERRILETKGREEVMKIRRALKVLAPLMVLLLAALPGFGQVDYSTATLKGTVLDASGAGVPGATVTITNPATGLTKTQKSGTDPAGSYQFALLPIGTYQVEVTAQGFDKAVAKDIVLTVGQASVVDMHMTVGASNVVVEVTTAAPLIPTEQVQQANDINPQQVEQLPNVSRTFDTYAQTLPGITNAEAVHESGSQRAIGAFPTNAFTTSGGNGRGGLVTIDGGENDYGSGVTRTYHLPVDAIQEFEVNRNGYNAEYGFSYNEAVSIVTKSGTNNFHGAAFGAFRDEATDANQYFQPLDNQGNRLFDQDTHLGGNFGGALIKDKLFFFMDYEGYQTAFKSNVNLTSNSIFTSVTGPQQAYINDVLAGGASCGVETCATLAADLTTALTPADNRYAQALLGTPHNSVNTSLGPNTSFPSQAGTFTQRDTWNDGVIRLDWQPDSNNSFYVRGLAETEVNPGAFGGTEFGQIANLPPDAAVAPEGRDFEVVAGWSHIFSPTLVNALRFQAVPEYIADVPYVASSGGQTVPFSIIGGGFASFGPVIGAFPGYESREKRFQVEDSVSWTKGNHSIKFGLSYRPADYDISDALYAHSQIVYLPGFFNLYGLGGPTCALAGLFITGGPGCGGGTFGHYTAPLSANDISAINSFNGAAPANFLAFAKAPLDGLQAFEGVLPVQFRTSFGNPTFTGWGNYGGVYVQDTWKITPRLTVLPGVRFDINAEPFPTGGTQTMCEPLAPASALTVGATSCTGAMGAPVGALRTFQTNPQGDATYYVSPRLGFAYDLTGDGKTVLRGSAGAFVGASELQVVYYSHLYNPNGANLVQEEITLGQDNSYFGLIAASAFNGNLPVLPPTLTDYREGGSPNAGLPGQPHGVIITQGDHPCGGGQDPFGCGTYRSAYSSQASLGIQRQLGSQMSLDVAYNFQATRHLQDPLEVNFQQALSQPGDPGGAGKPLIDPYLGPMLVPINPNVETGTLYCSCGDAEYNGLTVSLTRRFANHFQFQANYTYSRSTDDVLDFSSFNSSFYPTIFPKGITVPNPNGPGTINAGRDYGQSAYNLTHILTGNMVYTTPFDSSSSNVLDKVLADITLSNIVTVNSGIPFEVLINPGQGLATECTTLAACAAGGASSNGLVQEALNQARPFDAPRNSGIGPWNTRWDMAVRKAIYINKERGLRLEVSANLENLLNHTNFLGVNGVFSQAAAGSIGAGAAADGTVVGGVPTGVQLLNGSFVNLVTGPYNFHGVKAYDTAEKSGVPVPGCTSVHGAVCTPLALGADPLAYVSAGVPRLAQFVLRLSF